MPAVGATKFWMNDAPPVEPLRLRRVPLMAAVVCFAAGDLIALRWQPPLLLVASTALLLALSLFSLRRVLRVAIIPTYTLWIALGCWCAQIQPPIPQQQSLQHAADGLSRTVRGTVIRVRTLPAPNQNSAQSSPQPEFEPGEWDTDPDPGIQSIDLDVQSVEQLTPDLSTLEPTTGGIRITLSGAALTLHCGDTLEIPLRLRTPDVYRDPGAFSYSDYLLSDGIGATSSAKSSSVQVLSTASPTLRCRVFAAQA